MTHPSTRNPQPSTDLAILNEVIAEMRLKLAADRRGELPPAVHPDGTPVQDPQIAFFARMMAPNHPSDSHPLPPIES